MKNRLLAGIAHRPESTMVHLASYTKEVERVESHPEAQQGMVGVPGWRQGGGPAAASVKNKRHGRGPWGVGGGCQARPSGDKPAAAGRWLPLHWAPKREGEGGWREGRPHLGDWTSRGRSRGPKWQGALKQVCTLWGPARADQLSGLL